jgi:RNA polymerase-binding transcription factor DksA
MSAHIKLSSAPKDNMDRIAAAQCENRNILLKLIDLMAKKKEDGKLTPKQLARFRELLLEKRKELLGDVECMEETIFQSGGELSNMPVHMADVGSDNFEQEFSLGLMAEGKKVLVEIDLAIQRIEDGTFGVCEGLGVLIETPRLEAIPWTRFSLEHAKQVEKGRAYNNYRNRPLDIERDEDSSNDDIDEENETEKLPEEAMAIDDDEMGIPTVDADTFDEDEEDEEDIKD